MQVGRLCTKLAGRDAGNVAVIVDIDAKGKLLLDGNVRRRAVNAAHVVPMEKTISITKGASHDVVVKEFEKLGLETRTTKPKPAAPAQGKPKPAAKAAPAKKPEAKPAAKPAKK